MGFVDLVCGFYKLFFFLREDGDMLMFFPPIVLLKRFNYVALMEAVLSVKG